MQSYCRWHKCFTIIRNPMKNCLLIMDTILKITSFQLTILFFFVLFCFFVLFLFCFVFCIFVFGFICLFVCLFFFSIYFFILFYFIFLVISLQKLVPVILQINFGRPSGNSEIPLVCRREHTSRLPSWWIMPHYTWHFCYNDTLVT